MKNLLCLLALLLCTTVFAQPQQVVVGVSGNGYVTRQQDGARITQRGVTHWTNPKSIVSIYFYLHKYALILFLIFGYMNFLDLHLNLNTLQILLILSLF